MSKKDIWLGALVLIVASPFLMLGALLYLLAEMLGAVSGRYEAALDRVFARIFTAK